MNKTFIGWLQIGLAAVAAAAQVGVIPSTWTDVLVAFAAALAGSHALTSGSQVQNPPKA